MGLTQAQLPSGAGSAPPTQVGREFGTPGRASGGLCLSGESSLGTATPGSGRSNPWKWAQQLLEVAQLQQGLRVN